MIANPCNCQRCQDLGKTEAWAVVSKARVGWALLGRLVEVKTMRDETPEPRAVTAGWSYLGQMWAVMDGAGVEAAVLVDMKGGSDV